jgi:hypothetical protein
VRLGELRTPYIINDVPQTIFIRRYRVRPRIWGKSIMLGLQFRTEVVKYVLVWIGDFGVEVSSFASRCILMLKHC